MDEFSDGHAIFKTAKPAYTCPTHGDQTDTAMHIRLYEKKIHRVFCVECFADKLAEIGVQELKQE